MKRETVTIYKDGRPNTLNRARGAGNGEAFWPYWVEDCAACKGRGWSRHFLFLKRDCDTCSAKGRVVCGTFDMTPEPDPVGGRGWSEAEGVQHDANYFRRLRGG